MAAPLRKVYVRYREGEPDGANAFASADGFRRLGTEVVPFYGFGDVEEIGDLGPEVGLSGYVGDVQCALAAAGAEVPPPMDYPASLFRHLHRGVWKARLEDVRRSRQLVFVKPVERKLFSGFVWSGSRDDRIRVAAHGDAVPVWASDPVSFISEYRCFVMGGEVLGVRPYKGDWSAFPDPSVIRDMASVLARSGIGPGPGGAAVPAPAALAIDVGVTAPGRTALVEVNDSFALGSYGLDSVLYARMISARWMEMVLGPRPAR